MAVNIVPFPPACAKVDGSLSVMVALGQARAIVQLLIAAHAAGRIEVATADDVLDEAALSQALWAADQQLGTARKAFDDLMADLARQAREDGVPA